ncbi:CDP-glycerol glycerophosphotransferase family protein [Vibrio methylphosphonaticus]|uniref:CDP-glycerol glycerophosphotransferase family protein n=1 Tax=Vibrio methylphosphonaticus TaxID=2946866 RepID=UPI002029BB54|nr:CDP-glycerol glycerophosphotransferase family protein [Vibrio methylphosphonaticus]MCL9775465.1 CDP-glycerol glycerophosphotransferase family protein [Vibrio methylphosphonaticus]
MDLTKNLIKFLVAFIVFIFRKAFSKNNVDLWLIGERRSEAKDNGYHLFRYIRNNYPEKNIYYVIERKSTQKTKVDALGKVIEFNSLKHYVLFFEAEKLILPFEKSTFPDFILIWYAYRMKLLRKKTAFIQHGVTKEKQVHYAYNNRFKFDLFVCAAEEECAFVQNELDYPSTVARKIGFARHDNLPIGAGKENIIFFMPTWRSWISDYTEEEFLKSEYYNNIYRFLNSSDLDVLLEKHDMTVYLYLHDIFQDKFSHLFSLKYSRVIVANKQDYDVQDLMIRAKILITDFSSVAFDFAYMEKPVFYYQFDQNEYNARHFLKGYFDYYRDGFGPVHVDSFELIEDLKLTLSQQAISDREYINRSRFFFGEKDSNNCERNYKAIDGI